MFMRATLLTLQPKSDKNTSWWAVLWSEVYNCNRFSSAACAFMSYIHLSILFAVACSNAVPSCLVAIAVYESAWVLATITPEVTGLPRAVGSKRSYPVVHYSHTWWMSLNCGVAKKHASMSDCFVKRPMSQHLARDVLVVFSNRSFYFIFGDKNRV